MRKSNIDFKRFFYPISKFGAGETLFCFFQPFIIWNAVDGIVPDVGEDKIIAGAFIQTLRKLKSVGAYDIYLL